MIFNFLITSTILLSLLSSDSEFIVIRHVGNQDYPVNTIVIVDSDSIYSKHIGLYHEFGIRNIEYKIVKQYIMNKQLLIDEKCDISSKWAFGAFSIQIYEEEQKCYLVTNKEESTKFFLGLNNQFFIFHMDSEVQTSLFEVIERLREE